MTGEPYVLVHRGVINLVSGSRGGRPTLLLPIAYSHDDAKRLAALLSKPDRRVSPAPLSMRGRTLEDVVQSVYEQLDVQGAAHLTGWRADGSPIYAVQLRRARTP